MKLLALDVGERRTGVAFFDPAIDFVIPLDTIHHVTEKEIIAATIDVATARQVERIVVGLPLLPSGLEGSQARFSRGIGSELAKKFDVEYIDERFTTIRSDPGDGDAKAACIILNTYLQRQKA